MMSKVLKTGYFSVVCNKLTLLFNRYLGTGELELKLVDAIYKKLQSNPNVKFTFLMDKVIQTVIK